MAASDPGPDPDSGACDVGAYPVPGSMSSMDNPRQPAFWRFAGTGAGGLDACARTFARKTASYRARLANCCCFAAGGMGVVGMDVDVEAETEAREDMDVREVVVPCERSEERSDEAVVVVDWMDVRAEGGREREGGGGSGAAAAVGGIEGGGGGMRRVLAREREELLAEGVRIRTGEAVAEGTGEA